MPICFLRHTHTNFKCFVNRQRIIKYIHSAKSLRFIYCFHSIPLVTYCIRNISKATIKIVQKLFKINCFQIFIYSPIRNPFSSYLKKILKKSYIFLDYFLKEENFQKSLSFSLCRREKMLSEEIESRETAFHKYGGGEFVLVEGTNLFASRRGVEAKKARGMKFCDARYAVRLLESARTSAKEIELPCPGHVECGNFQSFSTNDFE